MDRNRMTIASIFLTYSFEPSDRLAVVLLNKRHNMVIQRLAQVQTIAAPDFQEWLEDRNRHRFDVYVSMNALHPQAAGCTKDDVSVVRHSYLDFDHGYRRGRFDASSARHTKDKSPDSNLAR
jgi:hypothetical protein